MKKNELHPSPFEIGTFILIIITSILGAIIGLEIISSLGVTPNTSIIGALIAMVLARLPLNFLRNSNLFIDRTWLKHLFHRQLSVQQIVCLFQLASLMLWVGQI